MREKDEERVEGLRERDAFYCLDWEATKHVLYGGESDALYSTVDLEAMPCQTYVSLYGLDESDPADFKCNQELDAAIQYLGSARIIVYHNEGVFNVSNFDERDDGPVEHKSSIVSK